MGVLLVRRRCLYQGVIARESGRSSIHDHRMGNGVLDALHSRSVTRAELVVALYHHSAAPALVLVSPSSDAALRSSERSSAASTRRLAKSNAADWRSRGRGRSVVISS